MSNPYISDYPAEARSKLPSGTFTLYTNYSTGSDDITTKPGLSPSTPFKTVQAALQALDNYFDFNGYGQTTAVIQMADNVTDLQGVHFSPHAMIGAQGGAAVKILGGTNSASAPTSGSTAVDVFFGAVIEIGHVKLSSPSGACIGSNYGATVYLLDGLELGSAAGNQVNITQGSRVILQGDINVSGNAYSCICNQGGFYFGYGSFNFLNNVTYAGAFVYANQILASFGGQTINLNGHTVTGQRWVASFNGNILTPTGVPNTYFPGTSNGAAIYGGQCQ